MNEDKVFDQLEKIYVEVRDTKMRLSNRMDSLETEVKDLKTEVAKIGVTLGSDIKPKIEALFDGYVANTEQLNVLDDKIDNMQMDINSISMKTSHNDNHIIEISKKLKSIK